MNARTLIRSALGSAAVAVASLVLAACSPSPVMLSGHLTVTGSGTDAVGVEVVVYSSTTNDVVLQTVTDTTGHYVFNEATLTAGTYRVRFSDTDWWQGATSWADATNVTVAANTPATINESLVPATGSISGTVTTPAAAPIAGVTVTAYSKSNSVQTSTTTTAADGIYTLSPVPTGAYRLQFTKTGLTTRFAGNATNAVAAPITTVSAGATTTGVNTTLLPEAQLAGLLYIGGYSNGVAPTPLGPVGPVEVRAFETASHLPVAMTVSDSNSLFFLTGLNPGSYTLSFTDPTGLYADLYPSQVFTVAAGQPATANYFQLQTRACASITSSHGANLAGKQLQGCNLSGLDLSHRNLTNANLSYALAGGTDFSYSSLDGASLQSTSASSANLTGTSLVGAQLTNCQLNSANLTGANLTGANLTGANLIYSTLGGAAVGGAQLPSVAYRGSTSGGMTGTPASGPPVVNGYLLAPQVIATGADLSNGNLAGADLRSADLTGANFTNDDLRTVNLSTAQLHGSTVTGANLSNATNISRIRTGGLIGTPAALPAGWRVVNGWLVGTSADLNTADLSGANLTGLDLSGALLQDTVLTGANLTNVKLNGAQVQRGYTSGISIRSGSIIGTPTTMLAGWKLYNGWLVGTGADLRGADLSALVFWDGDLSYADLTNANLTGASLRRANLIGTHIDGANLTNADLSESVGTIGASTAIYANTTCKDYVVVSAPNTCIGHGWVGP